MIARMAYLMYVASSPEYRPELRSNHTTWHKKAIPWQLASPNP